MAIGIKIIKTEMKSCKPHGPYQNHYEKLQTMKMGLKVLRAWVRRLRPSQRVANQEEDH